MQAPQTQVSTEKLLALQLLQEREIGRLLGVVREQQRELARLKGQDEDQAELELLRRLETIEVRVPEGSVEAPRATPSRDAEQRGHGPRARWWRHDPRPRRRADHARLAGSDLGWDGSSRGAGEAGRRRAVEVATPRGSTL